jgi:hypothetical protein
VKKIRICLICLILAASALITLVHIFRWSGESGAELAQQKFLENFTKRKWKECHGMVASTYSDKWQLERNELSLLMQDFSRQFIISPRVGWQTTSITRTSTAFEINGIMSFEGGSGSSSGIILREIRNYTGQPFRFRWKHASMMPWSWNLESIEHPSLELPSGYIPGRSRMLTAPF